MIQLRVSRKRSLVLMTAMALAVLLIIGGWIVYSRLVGAYSGTGAGTTGDPFIINDCEQLQEMNDGLTASYALGSDIDCLDTVNWNSGNGFVPIGAAGGFEGNFDGRGYTISGLYIDYSGTFTGLFSSVQVSSRTIKNVTIKDASVTGIGYVGSLVGYFYGGTVQNVHSINTTVVGTDLVGGLVGFSYRSQILTSSSTGSVSGGRAVGGLVGQMTQAGITVAMSAGDVEGTGDGVGGLVGIFEGHSIYDAYSAANVIGVDDVGGLIGSGTTDGNFSVYQTYSSGAVTTTGSPSRAGGLIGRINMGGTNIEGVDIRNSFSVSPVMLSFAGNAGGLIGQLSDQPGSPFDPDLSSNYYDGDATGAASCVDDGTSSTCTEVNGDGSNPDYFKGSSATPPLSAWDIGNTWIFPDNDSLPILGMEIDANFASGQGSVGDPYIIRTCGQLQNMAIALDLHYRLGNDVDCSSSASWNSGKGFDPVGDDATPFTGSFDGDGYTITGLTMVRADDLVADSGTAIDEWYVGLFGYAVNATVQDLHMENTKSKGYEYVGGIIGYMEGGTLSDSSVNVAVDNDDNADCGAGEFCVWARYGLYGGGLVGFAFDAVISDSQTGGPVKGSGSTIGGLVGELNNALLQDSSTTSNVDGGSLIGGAVGYAENDATIQRVAASGDIFAKIDDIAFKPGLTAGGLVGSMDNSTVLASSASGDVHADVNGAGGLIGTAQSSIVRDSYATGNVDLGHSGLEGDNGGGLIGTSSFTQIDRTYSTGNVTAVGGNAGGLLGALYDGSVSESFATGHVSAQTNKGGLVGMLWPVVDGAITNSYYDVAGTGQLHCASYDDNTPRDPELCIGVGGDEIEGYFIDPTNAPFTIDDTRTWINGVWYFDGINLPVHSTSITAPQLVSPAPDPDASVKVYKDIEITVETYNVPLSGSAMITLVSESSGPTITINLDDLTAGSHTFTLHSDNVLLDSTVVSASRSDIPDGTYTLAFSYRDVDNTVTMSSTAHHVQVTQEQNILCEAPSSTTTTFTFACSKEPFNGWGATTWEARYRLKSGGNYTTITFDNPNVAIATVTGVIPGTWYRVEFRFTNNSGTTDWAYQDILTDGTRPLTPDDPAVLGEVDKGGVIVASNSGSNTNDGNIVIEKDDPTTPQGDPTPAKENENSDGTVNGSLSFWDWWWWILIVIGVIGLLVLLGRSVNKSK